MPVGTDAPPAAPRELPVVEIPIPAIEPEPWGARVSLFGEVEP